MRFKYEVMVTLVLIISTQASTADAKSNDLRKAQLLCTFEKHCYDGNSMKILPDRRVDFSQCADVDLKLRWDPITSTLDFDGKPHQIVSEKVRRRNVSINFKVGPSFVNFSYGKQRPTLRFRDEPRGSSPITDYYDGTCGVAN